MGTAYQPPALGTYEDRRHVPAHTSSALSSQFLSEAERKRTILSDAQAALALSSTMNGSRVTGTGRGIRTDGSLYNRAASVYDEYNMQQHAPPMASVSTDQGLQTEVLHQLPPPTASLQQQQQATHSNGLPSSMSTPGAASHTASSATLSTQTFANSRSINRPSTPTNSKASNAISQSKSSSITEKDTAAMVMHSLDIPRCISPRGGSLSDFTAELTCLFWFENPLAYQLADNIDMIPADVWIPGLCENAVPSPNFKSWVHRMLTTTQVTQNVVLLALLFIYRLKSLNPMVRGKLGSEFRLLTVALMLGNKFLDDNTYTNKTWSDVSSLNVKEIHVMEVEFLSNMRYSLLVSKSEWEDWLVKLAKFRKYYERASASATPRPALSPHRSFASPVPSPTGQQQGVPSFSMSPTASSTSFETASFSQPLRSAGTSASLGGQQQPWPVAYPNSQAVSPLAAKLDMKNGLGKRAVPYEDPTEPPPKRTARTAMQPSSTLPPPIPNAQGNLLPSAPPQTVIPSPTAALFNSVGNAGSVGSTAETRRLPAPQLTLNTSATQMPIPVSNVSAHQPMLAHAPQQPHSLSLPPPLVLGMRAMSTVYPSNTNAAGLAPVSTASAASGSVPAIATTSAPGPGFAPHLPLLTTNGPSITAPGSSALAGGGTTPTSFAAPAFGTPTKRMSPLNSLTPGAASMYATGATSSPLTENFPHMAGVHTPMSHSPSVYLQQRASPYRPIRNVHMLLNPPPSSSLQEYQATGPVLIPPTQMYYQPLGRRNDLRPGIVPEFQGMSYGAAMRQGLALTPIQTMQQQAMQQLQPLQTMQSVQQMQPMQAIALRDARSQHMQQQQHLQSHGQPYPQHQQ